MSAHRSSTIRQINSIERIYTHHFDETTDVPNKTDVIRVLVLDHELKTLEQIENALWVWPHKVSRAKNITEVVRLCKRTQPAAVIAAIDFLSKENESTIAVLRKRVPQIPIVALASGSERISPDIFLDQGADAFVRRDELRSPTLHDLLSRIQRISRAGSALDTALSPEMPPQLRDSGMIGALVCDVSGEIIDANDCIARWLEYPNQKSLLGKSVWRDLLNSRPEWSAWAKVADDVTGLLSISSKVTAKSGKTLWMKAEVSPSPGFPGHLQAVLVNQSEITLPADRHTNR